MHIIEIIIIFMVLAFAGLTTAPAYQVFLMDKELGYEGTFFSWLIDMDKGDF